VAVNISIMTAEAASSIETIVEAHDTILGSIDLSDIADAVDVLHGAAQTLINEANKMLEKVEALGDLVA